MAPVLKLVCQPNYQDGCALAGLIDQYSPGGIGSDRPSEKRKVGSSTLPLTTNFGLVYGALTSADADGALSRLPLSSDHDCPCVTVVGRSLSHADRTSHLRASGPQEGRARTLSGPSPDLSPDLCDTRGSRHRTCASMSLVDGKLSP
jgi:hypothetical protein